MYSDEDVENILEFYLHCWLESLREAGFSNVQISFLYNAVAEKLLDNIVDNQNIPDSPEGL